NNMNNAFNNIEFSVKLLDGNHFNLSVECDDDAVKDYSYSAKHSFGEMISTEYFNLTLTKNPNANAENTSVDFEFIINSVNKQVTSIQENLQIETMNKDATIVVMTYDDNVPERAVDILNAIGRAYINLDIKDKAAVASLTIKFVDEQLKTTSQQLSEIEQELQDFKEQHKTVDLSTESKALLDKINSVETDRIKSDIELQSLDNLLSYVTSNKDLTQMAPSSLGIPDPLLIELIQNFQMLQAKRKSLSYGIKNNAPSIRIIDQQIEDTRASLIENIKSIQQNINSTNKTLNSEIAGYESFIRKIPETERELLSVQRKVEVNQNIYVYLLQKKAETSIAKATVISDNKVLDEASLFDEPVAPNKKLLLAIALLLSVIIPVLFIIFNNLLKTTVSNREEITRLTDVPVIGVIGHLKKSDNLVVSHKPKSAISEAFRSVRTNLQFFGAREQKKIILITSSVGGEGKSFVSINLASVLAMQNFKVVIVGLDLRKPKLFQDFNLNNESGMSNFLIGQTSLDSIIRKTHVENLDLISSGPVPPNPAELISKKEMSEFFEELSKRYDYIIVDTPPLGIVSDAMQLMVYSHINVYIIRENFSKHDFIKSLNELYEEGKLKNICVILNDSGFSKRYGYSYGHNYGYMNGGSGYYDEEHRESFFKKVFRRSKSQV
ncbi:MAG: GumC family protein, partial [Bacteroidia bacterium]